MNASEKLKAYIKEHEDFSPVAYFDDYAGTPNVVEYSIGYGHQIQPGEDYLKTSTINEATANALMEKDLLVWENYINNNIKVKLNQDQFDALLNLCYAVGGGNALPIITLINSGASIDTIKNAWLNTGVYWQGVKRPGLVAMREKEVKMYFSSGGGIVQVILIGGIVLTLLVYLAKKL